MLLTISQAAEALTCSATTVKRLLKSGQLAYIAIGKRLIRIEPQAIDEYLARGRKQWEFGARRGDLLLNSDLEANAFIEGARRKRPGNRRKSLSPASGRLSLVKST